MTAQFPVLGRLGGSDEKLVGLGRHVNPKPSLLWEKCYCFVERGFGRFPSLPLHPFFSVFTSDRAKIFSQKMELSHEVRKMIEDEADEDEELSKKIPEAFICCICLDLLYKPIVLACGHISCFWCVRRSMSDLHESRCPVCRYPYHHFPTICQMLHFLLFKLYPVAYKRRETQIIEYEKGKGCFSLQLDDPELISEKVLCHMGSSQESTISEYGFSSHSSSSTKDKFVPDLSECGSADKEDTQPSSLIARENIESTAPFVDEEWKFQHRIIGGNHQQISLRDVLCTLCKELLFRPVVLNCGHVYCESCIYVPSNETIRCRVCQTTHPGTGPKLCLGLANFLDDQFPVEYAQRRANFEQKQVHLQQDGITTCSSGDGTESFHLSPSSSEIFLSWWGDHKVHVGSGCDCCGMYPIIGDRYRCKDCVDTGTYDLCEECRSFGFKLPGRFRQQHTPEHTFEIMRPNLMHNVMLRLLRGQLGEVFAAPGNLNPSLFRDVQEASESGFATESNNGGNQH